MEKLIIGSVYTSGEMSEFWYETQMNFIEKYTSNFEHVVFSNNSNVDFRKSKVIGRYYKDETNSENGTDQSRNHALGVKRIFDYFRKNPHRNCLLLDCDCFPVAEEWEKKLLLQVAKAKYYRPKIAAPIRVENLDMFPHPCAMFFVRNSIKEDWVDKFFSGGNKTMIQQKIVDNGCGYPLEFCYPLIRSNTVNLHPFFGAIYNHLFYHHGAATRSLMPRVVRQNYFGHYMEEEEHEKIKNEITERVKKDPEKLMKLLMYNE